MLGYRTAHVSWPGCHVALLCGSTQRERQDRGLSGRACGEEAEGRSGGSGRELGRSWTRGSQGSDRSVGECRTRGGRRKRADAWPACAWAAGAACAGNEARRRRVPPPSPPRTRSQGTTRPPRAPARTQNHLGEPSGPAPDHAPLPLWAPPILLTQPQHQHQQYVPRTNRHAQAQAHLCKAAQGAAPAQACRQAWRRSPAPARQA